MGVASSAAEARDLTVELESLADHYRPTFQARGGRLLVFLENDLPPVVPNAGALSDVLRFALDRAAEVTAFGGTTTLRSWFEGDYVHCCVSDDGPGLTAHEEALLAGDPGADHPVAGQVALLRRLEAILVVDSRPGLWTRIAIALPVVYDEGAEARTAEAATPLRVAVVDDEPAVRSVARRFLERQGHEVYEAADGKQGLSLLLKTSVDVVLLDVEMPGMDGQQVAARLQRERPSLLERTVIMSGRAELAETHPELSRLGLPRLGKPFDLGDMIRVVERLG